MNQHLKKKKMKYQIAIHRRCLEKFMQAPSPVGHEWMLINDELSYERMPKDPAIDSILKSVHCKYKNS